MTADAAVLGLAKRLECIWNDGYEAALDAGSTEPRDQAYLALAEQIAPALELPEPEKYGENYPADGWLLIKRVDWLNYGIARDKLLGRVTPLPVPADPAE